MWLSVSMQGVPRRNTAAQGGEGQTLALKAVPSAPRMRKPNTLRTAQQVARLELTTGRDMACAVVSDAMTRGEEKGEKWGAGCALSAHKPPRPPARAALGEACAAMLRVPGAVRPALALARRRFHSTAPPPLTAPAAGAVEVDEDCIPLRATYAMSDYLPSTPASLPRETVLKLHRLAALEPPATELDWHRLTDLDELVAVVQAVRDVDTTSLGLESHTMVDARVRAESEPVDWSAASASASASVPADPAHVALTAAAAGGRGLLKLAQRTEGACYVAPMPENVRTRKRSSGGGTAADASAFPADEL